jgi:hypothetical protein
LKCRTNLVKCEALSANTALNGFDIQMGVEVKLEIVLAMVRLAANFTGKPSLSGWFQLLLI